MTQFSRTEMLIGAEGLSKLARARVIVFGLGGVGSFAAEALVRSGVGAIDLVDNDRVSVTNLNRQLIATHKTIGFRKVDVMKQRALEVNSDIKVTVWPLFFCGETSKEFDFLQYDYVIDAIDTVTSKLLLIEAAKEIGTPVISSMGTGNKLDPTKIEVADIYSTSVCPLARVMRRELRRRGILSLKTVYSREEPLEPIMKSSQDEEQTGSRQIPGSAPFVPPVAGMVMAAEVVRDLLNSRGEKSKTA